MGAFVGIHGKSNMRPGVPRLSDFFCPILFGSNCLYGCFGVYWSGCLSIGRARHPGPGTSSILLVSALSFLMLVAAF